MRRNKRTRKSKRRSSQSNRFEVLEPRHLLAGVYFDTSSGDLNVFGDNLNNVGEVNYLGATQVRASIDGQNHDFNLALISRVIFVGYDGDDQFTNNTSIGGLLYPHGGNDTIYGGSGNDQIVGGQGNDTLYGRGGDDQMYGSGENDVMFGGDGNDRMFGDNGLNEIHGEAGDDIIYGGLDADTINGGDGIDQMFGLAGNDIIDAGNGGVAGTPGIDQADLVLGLDGDDIITGGDGLNVFWAGNGNDIMTGGAAENRMHGQNGNDSLNGNEFFDYLAGGRGEDTIYGHGGWDYIFGGEDNDTMYGGDGNDLLDTNTGDDVVFGGAGDDTMQGWLGNDSLTGGEGNDIATYTIDYSNFQISGSYGDLTIGDQSGLAGLDTVVTVETLRFTDGDRVAVPSASQVIQVQPIIVSNNNGSNTAEFMGTSEEEANIKAMIDQIFAQADVDVEWLAPNTWNDSFANVGFGGNRPEGHLDQIVDNGDGQGIGHVNSLVLDMYFVELVPGFDDVGENTANGLAFVDSNGIAVHVGDDLPTFQNGRDVVAEVLAHEIAHNLGLDHVHAPGNLMDTGTNLTAAQIQTILDSVYTQAV